MTEDQAVQRAKIHAKQFGLAMAVVHAPAEKATDPTGPYDYCPLGSVDILFPSAVNRWSGNHCLAKGVVQVVRPTETDATPEVIKARPSGV